MTRRLRNVILAICGLVCAGSLVAYAATGARAYSRSPDPKLAQTNATNDLEDLFADEAEMEVQDAPRVQSAFAFGLLPGGPSDPLSVATFVVPAILVAAGALVLERRSRKAAPTSTTAQA